MNDGVDETRLSQPSITHSEQGNFVPGQVIGGKFKIISRLGAGGMGTVYRVKQIFLDKEYALKTMEMHASNTVSLQRFHIEAKAAASLDHPNLVKVHDFGTLENGNPYLVMDYIEGMTFAEYLKKNGPISVDKVAPLFAQVCFGLMAAHEKSIVHRDIKPGNLMLLDNVEPGSEGSVKLVDFGIAKLVNREEGEMQALTRTGEIFGSPLYMSPEQCSSGIVDHRSDIYSLGCVLFEMLTGTPPHMGQNAMRTMMMHQSGEVPSLKEATLGTEFPEALEFIVAKMLQKLPEHRYQNVSLVAHDLTMLGADPKASGKAGKHKLLPGKAVPEVVSMTSTKLFGLLALAAVIAVGLSGLCMFLVNPDFFKPPVKSAIIPSSMVGEEAAEALKKANLGSELKKDYVERVNENHETLDVLTRLPAVQESDVIKDGRKQHMYPFPKVDLGDLIFYTGKGFGKFYWRAIDTVWVPVETPIGYRLGETEAITMLQVPSIFAKLPGKNFKSFHLDMPTGLAATMSITDEITEPEMEKNVATALQNIHSWTNLEAIFIKNTPLNDDAVASFNNFKKLRYLGFDGCKIDPDFFVKQPFVDKLDDVSLTSLGPALEPILKRLSTSQSLSILTIDHPLTLELLHDFQSCPKLTTLKIVFTPEQIRVSDGKEISNKEIEGICNLKQLKSIELYNMKLTDEQINTLIKCSWLKEIHLTSSRYDPDSERLRAREPRIKFTLPGYPR